MLVEGIGRAYVFWGLLFLSYFNKFFIIVKRRGLPHFMFMLEPACDSVCWGQVVRDLELHTTILTEYSNYFLTEYSRCLNTP